MNLTIDIGNTRTKLIAFNGSQLMDELAIADGEWNRLAIFCNSHHFERGILSSVIKPTAAFMSVVHSLGFPVMELHPASTPTPLNILYKTPATLGADRLAAAVGAWMKSEGCPVLIVDAGTCITYDFVTVAGDYFGGNISPGVETRLKSLHEFTASLPQVEAEGDVPDLGYSTETAIRSGVVKGVEYEINGYISDYLLKYPNLLVYLTGGGQKYLHISEKTPTFADDYLVSEGLNHILMYNK